MTISKLVHIVFLLIALVAFVVFDKTLKWIWAELKPTVDYALLGSYVTLTSAIALGLAVLFTLFLYKKPGVFPYLSEVVAELKKVTWPSWDETKRSTVVVIVFTILLSAYLAAFDWVWQHITQFLTTLGA